MRAVSHDEFIALPAGTLYAHWDPRVMGRLLIKGESISDNDWWEHDLLEIGCDDADLDEGKAVRLEPTLQGRDAMYDSTRRFVVFDDADVAMLIQKLQRCIKGA